MFGRDLGFDSIESARASGRRRSAGIVRTDRLTGTAPNRRPTATTTGSSSAASSTTAPSAPPCRPRWPRSRSAPRAHVHPLDLDRVGVADGTEVKIIGARGSVVLPLVADETVQRGTLWAPFNQDGPDITDLVDAEASVTDVRIERF